MIVLQMMTVIMIINDSMIIDNSCPVLKTVTEKTVMMKMLMIKIFKSHFDLDNDNDICIIPKRQHSLMIRIILYLS